MKIGDMVWDLEAERKYSPSGYQLNEHFLYSSRGWQVINFDNKHIVLLRGNAVIIEKFANVYLDKESADKAAKEKTLEEFVKLAKKKIQVTPG